MNRQFRVLVKHFFGRLFDVDSTSPDADSRTRVIQLLGLLCVPGLMISFFMMGDHPAGATIVRAAVSHTDRLWLRVGDRYVFVAYGMVAMGLLMAFKWDSLFPDRRDYVILTSLPISLRRWFAAKVVALFAFLSLFIVAINFFSLLLVPPLVASQSNIGSWSAFFSAVEAHAAATLGGSLFAALFFGALQGVLINVLTPDAFRRISPRVQMLSIAALVTLLLLTPLVKDSIPKLAQAESPFLDYFPLMWFLGLYEALIPGGSLMPTSIVWAFTAFKVTAIAAIVFAVSYAVGYRRYSKKVLESVEADTVTVRWRRRITDAILDRTLLRHPVERGTFHFIGIMSSRSPKHRMLTALYAGVGIALAVTSVFTIARNPSPGIFPFQVWTLGAVQAPLILAFVLISGLRATFNVPCELNANWMFQIVGEDKAPHFMKAVRKWLFLCRMIPLFAIVAVFEFVLFPPMAATFHLVFDLIISALLIEGFFIRFNKVPFTCAYSSNKIQLVALAAAYLYGFTIYVGVTGGLKQVITAVPLRMAVFTAVSFVVLAILAKRRQHLAITYAESDTDLLTLSMDQGYWRARYSPPWQRRGGRDINKDAAKPPLMERTGWLGQRPIIRWFERTTPSAAAKEASRYLISGAATPPLPRRGIVPPLQARDLLRDLRYGSRILWKSPGISTTAVLLIALVIGLNTTIYSVVHAFITRPAPGVHAKNLVMLATPGNRFEPFHAYAEYLEFSAQTKTLQSLIAYGGERVTFGTADGTYAMFGSYVTPNFFDTLGVQLIRGRGFKTADAAFETAGLVAVISHRIWQEQFQGSDDAIGRAVSINGIPATVIGVTEPLFNGAELAFPEDVWIPGVSYFQARGRQRLLTARADGGFGFMVMGQLRPTSSLSESQAEFATISARLQAEYPETNKDKIVRPMPYSATMNAGISHGAPQLLAIFSIVTAITLIIVCANVANLLLARAVARYRETALRRSLGASRTRVIRTLVAEGLAISVVAWLTASFFAYLVATYVPRLLIPPGTPNAIGMRINHTNMDLSPDFRVLAYAMLLAVLATVFFCVAPALRMWNQELLPGLKSGEHSVVRGRSKVASALVVVQLAFSVILLTSAGIAYRAVTLMDTLDVGFVKDNLLLVTVNPTLSITNRESNLEFLERARIRLQKIAGVQTVSYVRFPPLYGIRHRRVDSGRSDSQKPILANVNYIATDYFHALGVNLLLGRDFSTSDNVRTRKTAIVNQELARVLWPGQNALGQLIPIDGEKESAEVVGVAPNVLYSGREEPYFLFLAEQQDGARVTGQAGLVQSGETTFYLRYSTNLDAVAPAARIAVRETDERVPVSVLRTMHGQLDGGRDGTRTLAAFLSLFSGGSLLIAALGQYSVMAFEMKRRTREIGIRLAVGASGRQIELSALQDGLILTVIGLAIGFALSAMTGFALRGFLTGVSSTDARTYLEVFLVLAAASLVACYVPARRASRVDPLVTLRYE